MKITVKTLTKNYLKLHLNDFVNILRDLPHEYWDENNFLSEYNQKWKYSLVLKNRKCNVIGFLIASEKIDSIHIHKFMVKDSYRNKKLGRLLLDTLENLCVKNNKTQITLKVYQDNSGAIKFYRKNGFEIIDSENNLIKMIKII